MSKGRKRSEEIICCRRVDKRWEDSSRSNSRKAESCFCASFGFHPCSASHTCGASPQQSPGTCTRALLQGRLPKQLSMQPHIKMEGGMEEKKTAAPSSGVPESPDVSTMPPETSAARVSKRDVKMKVKPHTMNVCSKTHTHAVETGARQSSGKLGNLSQTHTPELPGTERQAGVRGRGGEESCSPQIFLSVLTSCVHSGLETHALAGKAGTRNQQHTERLPCTGTFSPDLIRYWQWGLPRRDWLFCPINNNTSSDCMHGLCLYF